MLYAVNPDGERVEASPKSRAVCPFCEKPVISKCGEIKIWHWAHESAEECDSFNERETQWHLDWKSKFPPAEVEVVIQANGKRHIADVKTASGQVIEFQHSSISAEQIRERESFYGSMVWVFDLSKAYSEERLTVRNWKGKLTFTWKKSKPSLYEAQRQIFFDTGDEIIIKVTKMFEHVQGGEPVYTDQGWRSPGSKPCWGFCELIPSGLFAGEWGE